MKVKLHILPDHRKLSYCEYGDVDGTPVFYFHGFPGSHIDVKLLKADKAAADLNIRLIAVNRPGYADSDFQRGRKLLDWPDDIAELADTMGINKFSVLGFSGGGPYALACGYKFPHRLVKVVVVSGMSTFNAPGAKKGTAMFIPKVPAFLHGVILNGIKNKIDKDPAKIIKAVREHSQEPDRLIIDQLGPDNSFLETLKTGLKQGPKGARRDAFIYRHKWGFLLSDVTHPARLWHGGLDRQILIETAEYMARELPNCEATFLPDEAHVSVMCNHVHEIFEALK